MVELRSALTPAPLRGNSREQLVGKGAVPYGRQGANTNNFTRNECRWKIRAPRVGISNLRIAFGNFYIGQPAGGDGGSNGGEQATGNAVTFAATLYVSFSTSPYGIGGASPYPVVKRFTWGGQNSISMASGASALSDPLGIYIPANAWYFVHVSATVANSGERYPVLRQSQAGEVGYESTSASTQIDGISFSLPSGGALVGSNSESFRGVYPMGIIGTPDRPIPAFWAGGDSILDGATDAGSGDGNGNYGFMERGCYNVADSTGATWTYPVFKATRDTDQAQYAGIDMRWSVHRYRMMEFCTHALWEWGTNDFASGRLPLTTAEVLDRVKRDFLHWAATCRAYGVSSWAVKMFPRTTASTSSYATPGDQTFQGQYGPTGTLRFPWNAWLDEKVADGTIDGVLNPASAIEDPANPGMWLTNGTTNYYTSDGTHPTSNGHIKIATEVIKPWVQARAVEMGYV